MSRSFNPASRLQCADTKNAAASPLTCAVTKSLDLKSPGINSCKKQGLGDYESADTRRLERAYHLDSPACVRLLTLGAMNQGGRKPIDL